MPLLDRPLAAVYDRLMSSSEQRWLGEARRHLLAGLTGRVLEIGAGTGANFQHYPAQGQVTATEPSIHFLKRARAKIATAQASIELKEADAQALPFANDTFDAAVATLVFCTIPDPIKALADKICGTLARTSLGEAATLTGTPRQWYGMPGFRYRKSES